MLFIAVTIYLLIIHLWSSIHSHSPEQTQKTQLGDSRAPSQSSTVFVEAAAPHGQYPRPLSPQIQLEFAEDK